MKKSDDPLPRLFRAAAPATENPPPPPELENQLIREWRNMERPDETTWLIDLLRPAVIFAGCILTLSIGWNWVQSNSQNTAENALANYAVNIQLPP